MRLLSVVAVLVATACSAPTATHSLTQSQPSATSSATKPTPTTSAGPTARATDEPTATGGTGVAVTAQPAPRPPATVRPTKTTPPPAGTTVVTDSDSGRTIRLHRGDRLEVRLSQGSWDPPTSSASAVMVRRSNRGGYPTSDPVVAVFEAVSTGTADVTTQTDYACFHSSPRCYPPVQQWVVHSVVA